jgi:hypothetical protein
MARHHLYSLVYWLGLSGGLPMRADKILSLTVTLPNEQHIEIPEAVVRWLRGQEFVVVNLAIKQHVRARIWPYVKRLVRESAELGL